MKEPQHLLTPVWEKYPEIFSPENLMVDDNILLPDLFEIFVVGDHYHYIIDIQTQLLSHQHENIRHIHGFTELPTHLQQIITLIHPEDIAYVLRAEDYCYRKVIEIGLAHIPKLKSAYCFRMLVADGSYRLFHHQAITIVPDQNNRISRSLNIHTDIQDITTENNYVATIMGIHGRTDFHQMNLSSHQVEIRSPMLTKRERQLLVFFAKGYSIQEIANLSKITVATVHKHRQNLLRKTETKNSAALIKKSLELGYI